MRPIRVSVGSATTSAVIPMDQYISPFNVGLSVNLTAGASLTYTVEHTFDDVFASNFSAATAKWYPHATLAAKTASADGNYAFPVKAVRLNVTAWTAGRAILDLIQGQGR